MLIRAGFEAAFEFSKPTAVLLMANVHPSRTASLREPERLRVQPHVAVSEYWIPTAIVVEGPWFPRVAWCSVMKR